MHLEDDGVLAYTRASIDPRTRERSVERVVVGRVALARFPAGGNPQRLDATHFGAVAGVVPHVGVPADGGFAALATRARDVGNVDIDHRACSGSPKRTSRSRRCRPRTGRRARDRRS